MLFKDFKDIISKIFFPINEIQKDLNFHYKIVSKNKDKFILQLKYSRSTFKMNIEEIVGEKEVLFNLEPIQSCFIGREYFEFLSSNKCHNFSINEKIYLDSKYGNYRIKNLDRRQNLVFEEKETGNILIDDPRNICLDLEILNKFDSSQAFYIGYYAALKKSKDKINDKINIIDLNLKRRLRLKKMALRTSSSEKLIDKFNLKKHIEGGFYSEYYRSKDETKILIDGIEEKRNYSTAIYFLLEGNNFSSWHKIKSDEIWHYHCGSPLTINLINSSGKLKYIILGDPLENISYEPSVLIEKNQWFSASVDDKDSFSFLSCTVSPGFEFKDFTLGNKLELLKEFPEYKEIIEKYSN